ncbi:MAG: tryptophan--tRNA ligase [Ignavibacteriaceae bacterium]|nr:tryptophan--tRNA ligase [Ignavibacteriaceae bacterium]
MKKRKILSGMRPTGQLHIGHLVGALENWLKLQDEYQSYHLIADYHVLTTNLESESIYKDSIEMLIDWLAVGLDPDKVLFFRQSQIKEHTELFLIFSMLITSNRLERNPTLKDQVRDLNISQIIYGHLGYPVLQAADILLYKGEVVPVGEDQVPHVEITRELARKFNNQYGTVFPEPDALLTVFPRLLGTDGVSKMSKSLNNAILLSDKPEIVEQRLKKAVTDPQKLRKNDPGRPDVCVIFSYHKKFNPGEVDEIRTGCESGALGCVDCKRNCASKINSYLAPVLARRVYFEENLPKVLDILSHGETEGRKIASETMKEVRSNMLIG